MCSSDFPDTSYEYSTISDVILYFMGPANTGTSPSPSALAPLSETYTMPEHAWGIDLAVAAAFKSDSSLSSESVHMRQDTAQA